MAPSCRSALDVALRTGVAALPILIATTAAPIAAPHDRLASAAATAAVQAVVEDAKLSAPTPDVEGYFGSSVAIDGDTAVVSHEGRADKAFVYTRVGAGWSLHAEVTPANPGVGEAFGFAVAIDGDTVLVGAQAGDRGANPFHGSVHVFTRSGSVWSEQAELAATDPAPHDQFGLTSVAIDGDTAVVGAEDSEINGAAYQGAAYVFTRSGSTWTEEAKLIAFDGEAIDNFGVSVDIDGDTAIIGAYLDDDRDGSAYIYARVGQTWTTQQKILANDSAESDLFGAAVAVDGETLAVGAYGFSDYQGAVYVFTRSSSVWSQDAKLTLTDPHDVDFFGRAVALHGDSIVVGSPGRDIGATTDAGAAYVYTPQGSMWTQGGEITESDGEAGDAFGRSVSLEGDRAIVGAPYDDGSLFDQGAAYIFSGLAPPPSVPTLSIRNAATTEYDADTKIRFRLTLSETSSEAVAVTVATADVTAAAGTDYISQTMRWQIPPGQVTSTFVVRIKGDLTAESTETFAVGLSDAVGASLIDDNATGTIFDDD